MLLHVLKRNCLLVHLNEISSHWTNSNCWHQAVDQSNCVWTSNEQYLRCTLSIFVFQKYRQKRMWRHQFIHKPILVRLMTSVEFRQHDFCSQALLRVFWRFALHTFTLTSIILKMDRSLKRNLFLRSNESDAPVNQLWTPCRTSKIWVFNVGDSWKTIFTNLILNCN